MNSRSIINHFIITVLATAFLSCCAPTVVPNFTLGKYTLTSDNSEPIQIPLYINHIETILDGDPLRKGTVRAAEIQDGIAELADLMHKSGLFRSVEANVNQYRMKDFKEMYRMEVRYIEDQKFHALAAGCKGFLSGFFTLGLVPPTLKYSFSSKMEVTLIKDDSIVLSTYSTKTAYAKRRLRQYGSDGSYTENVSARKLVTKENNKAVVEFLVKNCDKLSAE